MPIKSIEFYKTAIEKGNSLATANLATEFLNSGFKEESANVLNEANKIDSPHPNVAKTLALISTNSINENEKCEKIITIAEKQERFYREFAESYYENALNKEPLKGDWVLNDKINVNVKFSNNKISLSWTEESTEFTITGKNHNSAFLSSLYESDKSVKSIIPNVTGVGVKYKNVYGYLNIHQNELVFCYKINEEDFKLLKFKKNL